MSCPLSGMVQILIVVVTLLLMCQGIFSQMTLKCGPSKPTITMYDTVKVICEVSEVSGADINHDDYQLIATSDHPHIAEPDKILWLDKTPNNHTFDILGNFLGKTIVTVKLQPNDAKIPAQTDSLDVTVTREKRVIDTVFTASVATLVSLMYINFGCALNWDDLKKNVKRPIGPAIGFVGQFLFMPLVSFGLAKALFPENIPMQLGMFFTGVSPGGGASNMWAIILGGNIDLSITMTSLSTFASFGMMPLWLFTLGRVLFHEGKLEVPYMMISEYAFCLVIPLFIGFLMQRYLKKVSAFLVRILKGFSSLLLIFIVVFAIVTNLYLFELFSWQIIVAGLGLPWLGYVLAWLLAFALKQPPKDCLVIAIETGIQNTGISIFMLRFSLGQPEADLTTVVPVAVAIMTPLPLLCLFIYQKIHARCNRKDVVEEKPQIESLPSIEGNVSKEEAMKEKPQLAIISDKIHL